MRTARSSKRSDGHGPAPARQQAHHFKLPAGGTNLLVKHHGQDAPIHAAMQADAMLDKGDLDGVATWRRIVKAVEELLSKERPAGVTVQ